MEQMFYTLQEFMLHAEGVTYLLIAAALVVFAIYWLFLTERDGKD